MLFTEAGLEQATRLDVAALHAERFRSAGFKTIADLGCGIGADSLALSALGLKVSAFEQDSDTAALAAFNLASFPESKVLCQDAQSVDLKGFDALWLDPARRNLERKDTKHLVLRPEDFSPDLNWVFGLTKPKGVKLGPAFPHELIPQDAQAQWVSHNGDLVEVTLWFGALRGKELRVATMLKGGQRFEFEGNGEGQIEVKDLQNYVFEPDSTLIRSRLLGEFANKNALSGISEGIAYLTSANPVANPWLKTFKVLEVLPLDEKAIRKALAERDIGILEIKKPGSLATKAQVKRFGRRHPDLDQGGQRPESTYLRSTPLDGSSSGLATCACRRNHYGIRTTYLIPSAGVRSDQTEVP
jgi:hypothetical protein